MPESIAASAVAALVPFVRLRTQFNPEGVEVRPGELLDTTPGGQPPSFFQRLALAITRPEIEIGLPGGQTIAVHTSAGAPAHDLRPWLAGALALGTVGAWAAWKLWKKRGRR